MLFACGHCFHSSCADAIGCRTDQDCLLCGGQMIDAIARPFICEETEKEEIDNWAV